MIKQVIDSAVVIFFVLYFLPHPLSQPSYSPSELNSSARIYGLSPPTSDVVIYAAAHVYMHAADGAVTAVLCRNTTLHGVFNRVDRSPWARPLADSSTSQFPAATASSTLFYYRPRTEYNTHDNDREPAARTVDLCACTRYGFVPEFTTPSPPIDNI